MSFNKNIKTDYGAAGNGQVALTNVSITSGTNTLAVSTGIFVVGDIGKAISLCGAGASSGHLVTTISGFTDASHVTLATNALTTMTVQAMRVYWGTSDTTAFTNWQVDAKAQGSTPCVLTIPAGIYLNFSMNTFYEGVSDLTINMAGATLSEFGVGGAIVQGALGVQSARLNQVNAGDTVLSLVTPAQTSIFTVGYWVCLSSLEMQGSGGYPPNWVYFEYHQIIAIGSGTITIDAPATYTHKTTYPATSTNPAYETGGPATLFNMRQEWNQAVVINGSAGGTLDNGGAQIQVSARSITINDCTFYGRTAYLNGFGLDPTTTQTMVFNTCTTLLGVEADKDISSLTWNSCIIDQISHQSASIANTYMNTCTIGVLNGTSRNTTMSGCTVTGATKLGCLGYGIPQSFAASNCSFASIIIATTRLELSAASYTNGVFSALIASSGLFWILGIPGSFTFWETSGTLSGSPNWGHQAAITDMWVDATKIYLRISPVLSSAPIYLTNPAEPFTAITTRGIVVHPAQNVTFSNCTGCVDAIDLSQAGAGEPLYSYTKRTYISDAIGTTSPSVNIWGKVSFIKITVNTAASGVGPLYAFGQFGAAFLDVNNLWYRITIQIDLTQTGVRLITPTATTGAVGADVISFPGGHWPTGGWATGTVVPYVGTAITGGSVTIEIATVQAPTDNPPTLYSLNSVW